MQKEGILENPVIHYGSFLRGTTVAKIDGHEIPIEEVKRGDLLRGIGPDGEPNTSQVVVVARDFCKSYLIINTEDTQLKVSGKHRIYVGPDVPSDKECPHFVRASTLRVNDCLYFRGVKSRITDITEIHENTEVFNLKCERPGVAATHDDEDCWATFYAAGIAVHEMGGCAPIGIIDVWPRCGPAGTIVTITARNDGATHSYEGFDGFFGDGVCGCANSCIPGYVTSVTFGANAGTVIGSSRFTLTAIVPAGSGTVAITAATSWSGFASAFSAGLANFTYTNADFVCVGGGGFGIGGSSGSNGSGNVPFHQYHRTGGRYGGGGPTNRTIKHNKPANNYTTTKGIGLRRKWLVGATLVPPPIPFNPQTYLKWVMRAAAALVPNEFLELPCARLITPITFIPTEGDINTPWIVPNGVCQILVECQGDGGEGNNGGNGSDGVGGSGGSGGHGGGYGSSIITVIPGTIYNINITEGSGAAFQDQFFTNIVAGYSGDDNIGGGLGDIVYNGNPGGGGSPGGPQIEDNNGIGGNGGNGGTSGYNSAGGLGGMGAGLNGIPPAFAGSIGANYGGGGGGGGGGSGAGETPGFGGLGGLGFVRITWWGFFGLKSPRLCGGG